MQIHVSQTSREMAHAAAARGAEWIRKAIGQRGAANIILATAASQSEMLAELLKAPDIRWDRVTIFHLDEYVGLPITHPASFRKYLWERFHRLLPLPPRGVHYLNAEEDPQGECRRVGAILREHPIDVAFVGIGENGHLAFNDPPADFTTSEQYLVVDLDEACRRQQLGEKWFPNMESIPTRAMSMSIPQIMRSAAIVATVPDQRKARAVADCLEGPVTPDHPASILQKHAQCDVYLDQPAASLLKKAH